MNLRYNPDYIGHLACALAAERVRVEVELIGSILSDPARGTVEADRAGVWLGLFSQDDLRAMYLTVDELRGRDKRAIVRAIAGVLDALHCWDATDGRGFSRAMIWCPESLASLACSHPGPAMVSVLARQLRGIDSRQREARHCYCRLLGLLEGTIGPFDAPAMKRHQVFFAPSEARQGEQCLN